MKAKQMKGKRVAREAAAAADQLERLAPSPSSSCAAAAAAAAAAVGADFEPDSRLAVCLASLADQRVMGDENLCPNSLAPVVLWSQSKVLYGNPFMGFQPESVDDEAQPPPQEQPASGCVMQQLQSMYPYAYSWLPSDPTADVNQVKEEEEGEEDAEPDEVDAARAVPSVAQSAPKSMRARYPQLFCPASDGCWRKPDLTFTVLIGLAVASRADHCISVVEIYEYITQSFPFFRTAKTKWRNSVRHNLSQTRVYCKSGQPRTEKKGFKWTFNESNQHIRLLEINLKRFNDYTFFDHQLSGPKVLRDLKAAGLLAPASDPLSAS